MFVRYFFVLGLVNSILLFLVFIIRKKHLDVLQRLGWIYLLLAFPASLGIFFAVQEGESVQYPIFLGIFLAFLFMEWLLDYVFKIDFRGYWKKNWKWMIPYLVLYYAMNYGFIIMPWKTSLEWGVIMLGLFIVQIVANLWSHGKSV